MSKEHDNKSCPFCGGTPYLARGFEGSMYNDTWGIKCSMCDTTQGGCMIGNTGYEYAHPSPDVAWREWNKRHGKK